MPSNTADQQITLPVGADPADVPSSLVAMIADVEPRLVKFYADAADRLARNPTPNAGEFCYLAAEARWDKCVVGGGAPVWWEAFPLYARKASEAQVVNNSSVLVNDSHLILPVEANARYVLDGSLWWDSGPTADIKFAWTGPAGFTMPRWTVVGLAAGVVLTEGIISVAQSAAAGTTIVRAGPAIGSFVTGLLTGTVVTAAAAGNLTLQWAQNALEAVNTRVKQESFIRLHRVA